MAALSKDRNTKARTGDIREYPVKGATVIYAGAMAALNASGLLVPAATATTLKVVGRAEARIDNAGGADSAVRGRVGAGIYRFDNSGSTDAITVNDIGSNCYAVDDQTVAKTNGTNTRSVAGVIFDVDTDGVWVKFS